MSSRDHALRFARPLPGVLLAFAAGLACAPVTVTSAGASGDGGIFDAAIDASPGHGDSGVELEGGGCLPGDVATYHPVYHSPAVQPTACASDSEDLIDAFYRACLGTHATSDDCSAFAKANAACAACIVTPDSATAYGPVVDHGGFVTANVAGCIEVEVEGASDAGSGALGCAKAVDALDGCELAACEANCPVTGATSLAQYQGCTSSADGAGCSTFAAAASCTAPDSGVGVPSTCLTSDFSTFYYDVVPLFCLPPPALDAGTVAADGAEGD
jgi:hypothetical protein